MFIYAYRNLVYLYNLAPHSVSRYHNVHVPSPFRLHLLTYPLQARGRCSPPSIAFFMSTPAPLPPPSPLLIPHRACDLAPAPRMWTCLLPQVWKQRFCRMGKQTLRHAVWRHPWCRDQDGEEGCALPRHRAANGRLL